MRNIRFMRLAVDLLSCCGHPEIAGVEFFDDAGVSPAGLKVCMADGMCVRFRVVGTYGPGGDDFSKAEVLRYPDYVIPEGVGMRQL